MTQPTTQMRLAPGESFALTILGVPRQKKNRRRIGINPHTGKVFVGQNDLYARWVATARFEPALPALLVWQHDSWHRMSRAKRKGRRPPDALIAPGPLRIRAHFFRERNVGDFDGYLTGLQDLLQRRGVIADDKWLTPDRCPPLDKDASNPRVELVLTALEVTTRGAA